MSGVNSIEAFILAGGESRRMGSDKGLLLLRGKPMISYGLSSLNQAGLPVQIVSSNPAYQRFGYPCIPDLQPGNGPLGGLYTALRASSADLVLLLSCDMPLLGVDAVEELISHARADCIVAPSEEGKINPLFALYPKQLEAVVAKQLAAGKLRMQELIRENPHRLVTSLVEQWPFCLRNVNRMEELKELEAIWPH